MGAGRGGGENDGDYCSDTTSRRTLQNVNSKRSLQRIKLSCAVGGEKSLEIRDLEFLNF